MNYDTLIYEICEKLFSTYQFYSAEYVKDNEGFLICAKIYSNTNRFCCHFMKALIAQKGPLLVSFRCDDSGRPVIVMYNDLEP